MDLNLKGKSVVVTGGASNIGRAIVLGFAAEGADITIGDLDAAQAEKVAELARQKGAASVQAIKTDVTDMDQVKVLFKAATDKHGCVDVLVNGVGWDDFMFFTQTTPELWQKIIQINYVGVLNCTKCALDIMIPNQTGAIVSISSDASRAGEPREAVYGGVKAAINSFMNSFFTPEQYDRIAKSLPLRRLGRAEDTANAVVFLASTAAGYITGQVLSVSGGYTMVG